jgi:poly-gamma-glutamate capsule biosynthesis protein CapA/YwtB (metallophosphatase superfamily)
VKLDKSKLGLKFLLILLIIVLLSACQVMNDSLSDKDFITDPIIPKKNKLTEDRRNEDTSKETSSNENAPTEKEGNDLDGVAQEQVARLIFLGDTMMTGNVAKAMDAKGNDYPLSQFMPILKKSDFVIANLETAVGTSGILEEKSYAFQTDSAQLSLFDPLREKLLFSLANNHGMDADLSETMRELDRLDYNYIGVGNNREEAFQPYVKTINGVSMAVIAASRVIPFTRWTAGENKSGMASAYVDEPLLRVVQEWKKQVDYVIVYFHWGEELADQPNQVQLDLEEKVIEAGANLVIGSHPHVLQGIRWNDKKQLTVYSMGNFVFTTSTTPKANDTMALEIHLSKEKIEHVQVWPAQVRFGLVRYLEDVEERERVFKRLRELSPQVRIDDQGRITSRNE